MSFHDEDRNNNDEYMSNEPIKIRCWIAGSTDKAYQVSKTPQDRSHILVWIPRSQLEHVSKEPAKPGEWQEATITMPLWLAEDKDLV